MGMAKKQAKGCTCIDQVNEQLAPEGFAVKRPLMFDFAKQIGTLGPPQIVVERRGKPSRKKIPAILCSYCPVCGTKFPE